MPTGSTSELGSEVVGQLTARLAGNLYSCVLYGSSARGDATPGSSDINLLLVLEESTPAAHQAIADVLRQFPSVSPMVVERRGLLRTFRAFAPKFLSIRRAYRVLHGADCLADLAIDTNQERFLVEQGLRNQRMRCVHVFVTLRRNLHGYTRFALRQRTNAIVNISEMLRLSGISVPKDRGARLPVFERELSADVAVLHKLAEIKKDVRDLRAEEADSIHAGLHGLLGAAVAWLEERWPIV